MGALKVKLEQRLNWGGIISSGVGLIGNQPELLERDYLLSISLENFWVGGGWVQWDCSVSSAHFLSEFTLWELSREIWAEKSRSRAWQLIYILSINYNIIQVVYHTSWCPPVLLMCSSIRRDKLSMTLFKMMVKS